METVHVALECGNVEYFHWFLWLERALVEWLQHSPKSIKEADKNHKVGGYCDISISDI